MKSAILLYFVTIAVIFTLAVLPTYEHLPGLFSLNDKLNHLSAFFVLALLAHISGLVDDYRYHVLFLAFFAIFIEVVQSFLPTRLFSFADMGADALGVLLFLGGRYLLLQRKLTVV